MGPSTRLRAGLGVAAHARSRTGLSHRRLPRWVLVLAISTVVVAGLAMLSSSFLQVYRMEREVARLERLKSDIQERNATLREEIKLLHTSAYVEKIAREQLGLVKPGEITLFIVHPPAAPAADRLSPASQPAWPMRLWRALTRLVQRETTP